MFGLRETRYRGLAKVPDQAFAAVAAAGRMIAGRGRRLCGPPIALSAKRMAPRRGRLEEWRRRAGRQLRHGLPLAVPPWSGRLRHGPRRPAQPAWGRWSPPYVKNHLCWSQRDEIGDFIIAFLDYYKELIVSYRKIVGDLDMREVEDCMALYRRADSLFDMMQREVL